MTACISLTFAELGAVIHTLVVVSVLRAEVGVVVIPQRITASVPTVVGNEELVTVHFIADREKVVLGIAGLTFPVLQQSRKKKKHTTILNMRLLGGM